LALRHGEPRLVRDFVVAERPGAYLRIIQAGDIGAGDTIQVVWRPAHDVTIRLAFQAWLADRSLIPRLRPALAHLSPAWQRWIDTDPEGPSGSSEAVSPSRCPPGPSRSRERSSEPVAPDRAGLDALLALSRRWLP
jgi:hypothetical protein